MINNSHSYGSCCLFGFLYNLRNNDLEILYRGNNSKIHLILGNRNRDEVVGNSRDLDGNLGDSPGGSPGDHGDKDRSNDPLAVEAMKEAD